MRSMNIISEEEERKILKSGVMHYKKIDVLKFCWELIGYDVKQIIY